MIEEFKLRLNKQEFETKKPIDYKIQFIVKSDNLPKIMIRVIEFLSFEHLESEAEK